MRMYKEKQIYLEFSNDDDAVFYINGIEVHNTGSTCNKNAMIKLSADVVNALKKGDNLIAAQCKNPVGNGLLDFGFSIGTEKRCIQFEKLLCKSL